MASQKVHSKVGDVFEIPISEGECGFGQIVAKYKNEMLLVVVFERRDKYSNRPDLKEVVASRPLLIANTLDARIWHGYWTVLANIPVDSTRVPLPNYKVQIGKEMHIESYNADRARPATESELVHLMYRTCVAPIRLENALKAYYGVCEWQESFNSLRAELAFWAARIAV
jgi:hypothetical protein